MGMPRFWTNEEIVAAIQRWTSEHGHPPTANDWRYAGYGHPSTATVTLRFGSILTARKAAGAPTRVGYGFETYWTPDRIAASMLDHTLSQGSWPTQRQWNRAHGGPRVGGAIRPCTNTVLRVFGTWEAAKIYAGFTPAKEFRAAPADWRCIGCGTDDPKTKTHGCRSCIWRHVKRRKRAPGSSPEVIPSSRVSGGASLNKPRQRRPLPVATAGADGRSLA